MPPEGRPPGEPGRVGLQAVWDGLAFLGTHPNVRMTFLADLIAMILAQPRALLPAIAALVLGGGARTVGILTAGLAVGGLVAMVLSGPLGRVRRQGLAVVVSVVGWGASFIGFGAACWRPVGAVGHRGAVGRDGDDGVCGSCGRGERGVSFDDPAGRDRRAGSVARP